MMNNKRTILTLIVLVLIIASVGAYPFIGNRVAPPATALPLATADTGGFARAVDVRQFTLPLDHGPHFDYQTEWWYYTGNLQTEDGAHYGYQLTFFRRGLTPGAPPARDSVFATNQIYFAHFALTDSAGDTHYFAERFSRGSAGLAGSRGEPFGVWLENWQAQSLSPDGDVIHLQAQDGPIAIDLTLRALKPLVAHGNGGLSSKSDEPGNASYYLSYTRMATEGSIMLNTTRLSVRGESWFDHEWSTSALGANGVGWDWFSLQLSDGRELMFFQIRRDDGSIEPVSGGTLIEPDGSVRRLSAAEVRLEVGRTWRSPQTGGEYPSQWRVSIPSADIDLQIEPWVADQEMKLGFVYWEGAVRLTGTSNGAAVTGNGYIELTGYVGSMQGVF